MKKAIRKFVVAAFILTCPLFLLASDPPPPHANGGNAPNGDNTPVGGGAPIDGGLSILLVLGAAYGSKKVYKAFK